MSKDEKSSNEMKYLKLYLDEIAMWQEELSFEGIGYLLTATASYMRDGTIMEVPDNVRFAFADQRRKVDHSVAVYNSKVENGRKGGKQKAINASRKQETAVFKLPANLSQFRKMVAQLSKSGNFQGEIDPDEVKAFFNDLKCSDWYYRDVGRIQTQDELNTAIIKRLFPNRPP